MSKITIIGSGKAATALGGALRSAGHSFVQVWSRSATGAGQLAAKLSAEPVTDLSAVNTKADIYIIAVKDDAIAEVAGQLQVGDKVIAHTSGIRSKDLLKAAGPDYGVFYPFVSMTKDASADFKTVLLMIEGSNEKTLNSLKELAGSMSGNVKRVEEDQRRSMHLAAVFAHNFTNHMYAVAEKILEEKGLSFDTLRPLIAAHVENVMKFSPSGLQTGPAIRHDVTTIEAHLALLAERSEWRQLYLTMTEAIQQWHKKEV